jgi:hypothetical protein
MLFTSHALLSGIALYASAAFATIIDVNVGSPTGDLAFNPSSVVSHPISHYIDRSR